MSSEVPLLTDGAIREMYDRTKWPSDIFLLSTSHFARAIEQAVRTQWAAEVERVTRERDAAFTASRCECSADEACANLTRMAAERDSAQAEAKRLRDALEQVRDHATNWNHAEIIIDAALQSAAAIAEQAKSATPPGNATQAAGAREPLTVDEVIAECRRPCYDTIGADADTAAELFEAGVRFAERHHGIASLAAELKKD